jgi:hypothetical protein
VFGDGVLTVFLEENTFFWKSLELINISLKFTDRLKIKKYKRGIKHGKQRNIVYCLE